MVVCFPDSCFFNRLLFGSFHQSAGKFRVGASYSGKVSEIIFGLDYIASVPVTMKLAIRV